MNNPFGRLFGKFRKKPVVIDAMQWTGDNYEELAAWCPDLVELEDAAEGEIGVGTLEDGQRGHAKHVATVGDWIICGVDGEFYACKPDIFIKTYDLADGDNDQ